MKRFWRLRRERKKPQISDPIETIELMQSRQVRVQIKKHAKAFFHLLLGGAFATFMVVALISVAKIMNVGHAIKMRGVVQAVEVSTPVSHTIDGVVKSVLVTEGEVVREGQVLMTLDASDLQERQIQARKDMARLLLQSRCLQAMRTKAQTISIPEELRSTVAELDQIEEMKRGLRECKTKLQDAKLSASRDQNRITSLKDQAELFRRLVVKDRELRLSRRAINGDADLQKLQSIEEISSLVKAIDYTIRLSEVEQELFQAEIEIEKKSLLERRDLDRAIEKITDDLMYAEAELSRLDKLASNRFVYASASGRIQRLRIKEAGKRISAGAYIVEIAPTASDFEVITSVHLSDMAYINVGQHVEVAFSGSSPIPISVPGQVTKLSKVSANTRAVTIQISREDINRRDLLLGDRLLNGNGEQADAMISFRAETAIKALQGILSPAKEATDI